MENSFVSKEDEIMYAAMDLHSRHFNFYDLLQTGIPSQILNQDLYTLDEVAEISKMSIVTIRQYVRNGKLKAIKQWKNWMVPSNSIAKLVYERKHGTKLAENVVMLFISSGNLYEEESMILEYEFITVDDLLKSVNKEKIPGSIEIYMKTILEDAQYIEAVCNIENFFKKTGDLKNDEWKQVEISLEEFITTPSNREKFIATQVNTLLGETPKRALKTIENNFGPISDELTLLKIYHSMLELQAQLNRIIGDE